MSFQYLNLLHATVSFAILFFFPSRNIQVTCSEINNLRVVFTLLSIPLDLSRDMVGRIMVPQRHPSPYLWTWEYVTLHWQKGLCKCDYGKDLGWENYPGLSRWAKCNLMCPLRWKRKEGSQKIAMWRLAKFLEAEDDPQFTGSRKMGLNPTIAKYWILTTIWRNKEMFLP